MHLASADQLDTVARDVSELAGRLAARYWPGPLTRVLDARDDVPLVTRAGRATVAVRVPAHDRALQLLVAAGVPVAAPSANRSGRPSPTTAQHVRDDLGDDVDLVLDGGPCPVGLESTVVDARGDVPVVLREGTVSAAELGAVAGTAPQLGASPGTRHRHYAPRCRVVIAPAGEGPGVATANAADGARVALVDTGAAPAGVLPLAQPRGAPELGRRLYAPLREAEDAGVDVVVVEAVPEVEVGRAVMDRLRRAAGG